jgi:hypothetical protein
VYGGEICINHETFDKELKRTYVYCISSTKVTSLYPEETKTAFSDSFDSDAIVSYVGEIVDNLSRG